MSTAPTVAIVGATGAVGREFLAVLEDRKFPVSTLTLLASARSAGSTMPFRGKQVVVQELGERSFDGVDIALFSAGGDVSKKFGPVAARAGCLVIDNSSAFRMDPSVPLVVPEVNPEAVKEIKARRAGGGKAGAIIANPNCSTIILLVPVTPLKNAFGVERMVVSTYQAVSGAGAQAMTELEEQTRAVLAGGRPEPKVFKEPCAFNVFSHNSAVDPATGLNVEEVKMIKETHKIWGDASVKIAPMCVRVPVLRAHAESITLTLKTPATEHQVREILGAAPGVRIVDDRVSNDFPTPRKASGIDEVLVGRIRPDESQGYIADAAGNRYRGFSMFVAADQLRKGAALNAVQIAEMFV